MSSRRWESDPLLSTTNATFCDKLASAFSGRNALLALYLVLLVVFGTSNRVSFKLMQNATYNYSYFDSLFTTLVFVVISFIVIVARILTKTITPAMREYPKYKFAIMGLFDSLAGLIVTVGGVKVSGIMQSLLLQGAVPMTMLFSILILRPTGCDKCKLARNTLKKNGINFKEISTLPKTCTEQRCRSRVMVNGVHVVSYDTDKCLREMFGAKVILESSSNTWRIHLQTYYTVMQYIGALVVLAGLGVSLSGGLSSRGSSFIFELIFFIATVPMALSGVYKEIAFRDSDDMDVWYLNGWVALFQFLISLTYAPLAAVMSDLAIKDIPSNLWEGLLCWSIGRNTVVDHCLGAFPCGTGDFAACCDSCNAAHPAISELSAFWAMAIYVFVNIIYNVLLVAVIKYGSAALMYIASTLVLPLSSLGFTLKPIMGHNSQPFTWRSGAGLGIVLAGLIIYRFIGRKSQPKTADKVTLLVNANDQIDD